MKKILILLCLLLLVVACVKNEPQTDKNGNTPVELAAKFYDAINSNDVAKIKAMYSRGYYDSIVTKNGFLKSPDHTLFDKHVHNKMNTSKSYTFQEERSGFHSNNAEGVFSAAYKIVFTEDGAKKIGYPHLNDEICFRLDNNEWKITDKLKGY